MKQPSRKNNLHDEGYIPFELDKINKIKVLDCILILNDGSIFFGRSFGSKKTSIGEICFNTSLTGYQEIITDPSYANQIITFTFPHIGNIGTNNFDNESTTKSIAGIVVRQHPTKPSNWRSHKNFNEWLVENDVPGISGIDTRLLTKTMQKHETCNAILSYNKDGIFNINYLKDKLKKHPSMNGLNLSSLVTTKNQYHFNESLHHFISTQQSFTNDFKPKIVVIDFGVKQNILRHLVNINAEITIMSENSQIEDIKKLKPDGIFLSNGPGDPKATHNKIKNNLRSLFNLSIPTFGICLGHQILALSFGAKTKKMHHGHRGANHPVKNLITNAVEITSQNHGFAVEDPVQGMLAPHPSGARSETSDNVLGAEFRVRHVNSNDGTVEGLDLLDKPAFTIQFHPEACPGPHDASPLFDRFQQIVAEHLGCAEAELVSKEGGS